MLNYIQQNFTPGNGVNLTGLLGGHKEDWGSGTKSPRSLSFFCETTHNICIKIQQTTVVAVTG